MGIYYCYVSLVDVKNRKTSKTFESVDLVDEAAALAAAAALVTDLAALTGCRVLYYHVRQEVTFVDAVDATANKDEGLTLSILKEDNKLGNIQVPAPPLSIFDATGNLITTPIPTVVSDFTDHFLTGGNWTFSDGEQGQSVVSGQLDE